MIAREPLGARVTYAPNAEDRNVITAFETVKA